MGFSHIKTDDINTGYVAYNGYIFSKGDARGYNAYNYEIKRAVALKDASLVESLLNRRALYFKLTTGA